MQRKTVFDGLGGARRLVCGGVADRAASRRRRRARRQRKRRHQRRLRPPREPEGRWSYHDWPTGHYRVNESWPKPLPDTRHSHDGWTWGSFGGVYAESPDRIWLAMRGELPLPEGRRPGRRMRR